MYFFYFFWIFFWFLFQQRRTQVVRKALYPALLISSGTFFSRSGQFYRFIVGPMTRVAVVI